MSNNPATLGIADQYSDFVFWYDRENTAFEFIRRSEITEEKEKADHARDLAYTGLSDFVKSAVNHYDPAVAVAAHRLMMLIETYNHPERLTKLAYDAETASIHSLIDNLNEQAADVAQIGLQGWITALQTKNQAFEALALQYIETVVGKPEYNMLQSRRGVEKSMRTMFHCIEALIIMNGETAYTTYVNALNAVIKHYNDVYAIHLGRYEANKDKQNTEAGNEAGEP
ncbi:MAG: DUF6261 family protein [Tannerella sp.]|nr:DUF6261 family protein [Tannerella sp.]